LPHFFRCRCLGLGLLALLAPDAGEGFAQIGFDAGRVVEAAIKDAFQLLPLAKLMNEKLQWA
jgi:hypothetical protein